MNESGIFVKKLVEQYKLDLSDLWVIHDDLDIPLGSYKIQKGKGPKIHKGLMSIDKELGTDEYWHVRIGVDNRPLESRIPGEEYVLEDFRPEEIEIIQNVIEKMAGELIGK
jgi:PTH1 family peptidyl-tRNA hydrolase